MVFGYILGNTIYLLVTLLIAIFAYYKWIYQYWQKRNLPFLEPSIPYGNTTNPRNRKEHISLQLKHFYDEMKAKGWKHGGIYMVLSPAYLVVDLDYLKNVMTKDFQYFTDRGRYYNEKDDPLSAHLFALGGYKWRNLRTKLTPTFTSGKMKMMFQTLVDCAPDLLAKVDFHRVNKTPIDIKETVSCFTLNIIGSCAFGLDCNTFKEENSPFKKYGQKFFVMDKYRLMMRMFMIVFPNAAKKLGVKITPSDVSEFFLTVVKDTLDYRAKNNYIRRDFLQLLIDLKSDKLGDKNGYNGNDNSLTFEEIAAQCFVFFIAGFETSASTMTFALYELSRNQKMQDKVRREVDTILAKYDGKITYEAIQDMKYMDMVINETLRKYPPVSHITRRCVKDYKTPDKDVVIEKGTMVFIPILAIHHDEEYYPEPEKFEPERFTEENRSKRHPYAHIPFGEGPRICIGKNVKKNRDGSIKFIFLQVHVLE